MATPAALLGIGAGAGQVHVELQEARSGEGTIREIACQDLAAGYTSTPYFIESGIGVRMRAPADGPKTSVDAAGARCEFRETSEDGSSWLAFNPFDGSEHWVEAVTKITHHPTVPTNSGLVVMQAQNGSRDRLTVRTQLVSGTLRLRYRENGSSVWQGTDTTSGNLEIVTAGEANIVGVEHRFKLHFHDGNGTTCVADLYYNGVLWRRNTAFTNTDGSTTWYFKTGVYNQFEAADVTAGEYGEVELKTGTLQHWHTGWAQPGSGTAPAPEPLYVASTEYHGTADGSDMTLSTPAAESGTTGVGDLLLFIPATGTSNGAWTVPSGFTSLFAGGEQGNMNARMAYRICTGSESASYVSQLGYTYRRVGVFARYRRSHPTDPIRATGVVVTPTGGSQTTCPTPTDLAGTAVNDLVIRVFIASETSATGTQTITPTNLTSAGWSVRQSIINETTTDEACGIILADKVGATDRPVPTTNKSSNWMVYSLSVKAAPWTIPPGQFLPFFS